MSEQLSITVDKGDNCPIIIPVQPGGTILRGTCGVGKSVLLAQIAAALGNPDRDTVKATAGDDGTRINVCGVVLSVTPKRASITGEIVMDEVFCPEENAFPEVRGLKRHGAGPAAGVAPLVVGDAQQPGGEGRAALEAREAAVSLQEGVLGEVVGQRVVAAGEVPQKIAHRRLVAPHEFAERRTVIAERAGDQIGIGLAHDCGGRSDGGS